MKERGVFVSDKRIEVENKTYPIAGITSVRFREIKPSVFKIAIFLIAGTFFLGIGILQFVAAVTRIVHVEPTVGGFFLAIGVLLFFPGLFFLGARKGHYSVLINGAISEQAILVNSNKFWVKRVYRAINQAIVERGSNEVPR